MSKRKDKCKCGKFILWENSKEEHQNGVVCKHCNRKYTIDGDTVMVYWLVEEVEKQTPYTTNPR